ncbi:MAG: hypothetical protein A2Z74_06550 [Chloroflexi bacterium RBG_13_46_9]|jgi:uncharacterized repeat protein (TIGR04076 family)|nr:MAG: hypothetical protein A2Z74_06550 [Chloroflexi bacterium RBG_13_46_9]
MSDWYKVKVKVISQKGHCEAGHKAGDEFVVGDTTTANMCTWALYTLFPFISALQSGGSFPWEKETDTTTVACPDPTNPVVFELMRIKS